MPQTLCGRDLIDPGVFQRLTARVSSDHAIETRLAERIVDQAAAFLKACATVSEPLSPSATVDRGWHAFVLHTRDYQRFCEDIAGGMIHHVPHEEDAVEVDIQAVLDRTMNAIRAAGMRVDEELWRVDGGMACSQCHNGCANDPPPNPK